jgi:hypothetical protein
MFRGIIAALVFAGAAAQAAPVLQVDDSYTNNVWVPPAACAAGTSVVPGPGCAPAITSLVGPPAGFRLNRANTAPGGQSFTRAVAFDNGVLVAGVESAGVENVIARSQFVETYNYIGPANTPFLVPFKIDRFSLATNSSGIGDLQRARMLITIDITTNSVLTNVATLDWQALSDSVNAFTLTPPPTPISGVTLAPGFLAFAGVTVPNSATFIQGPGGVMTVDLGSFATGQAFTLDYRMSCETFGSGAGLAFCGVGDPFSIPTGPGFDMMGLATAAVPEPATWGLLVIGFGLCGSALRRRRPACAHAA